MRPGDYWHLILCDDPDCTECALLGAEHALAAEASDG